MNVIGFVTVKDPIFLLLLRYRKISRCDCTLKRPSAYYKSCTICIERTISQSNTHMHTNWKYDTYIDETRSFHSTQLSQLFTNTVILLYTTVCSCCAHYCLITTLRDSKMRLMVLVYFHIAISISGDLICLSSDISTSSSARRGMCVCVNLFSGRSDIDE